MKKKNSAQLDLFGAPDPAPPTSSELAPIPTPDPVLVELASRVPKNVRFGTSSWTFRGWAGNVYRRAYPNDATFTQRSLEEYARFPLVRTVGIDRSYYSPIPESELSSYAAQLPQGFRCVTKVWQEITTYSFPRHSRWKERAGQNNPNFLSQELFRNHFFDPFSRSFDGHAGPFVFEIPPAGSRVNPDEFAERVRHFLREAPQPAQYAFEIRDSHLLTPRYVAALREHNATHVFNSWSRMPSIEEQRKAVGDSTADFMVARLMTPPGGDYATLERAFTPFDRMKMPQPAIRQHVIQMIKNAIRFDRDIAIIVNNKLEGSSPLTIKAIIELLLNELA